MSQKRLRIFAGPNGSGKSSLLKSIPSTVPLGFYINADKIETVIVASRKIRLADYGIKAETKILHKFFDNSDFVKNKSDAKELKNIFSVKKNFIHCAQSFFPPEYSAAIIAEFLREKELEAGNNFSFETVMSHENKIQFIRRANRLGYHVYLYFICTDDVRVNIERVKTRVREGGHFVPEEKIRTRYLRTLDLLYPALKASYKSYLFDNSDEMIEIARINRDKRLHWNLEAIHETPNWFGRYVLRKT
jgi:predicted ABC-type ATPase